MADDDGFIPDAPARLATDDDGFIPDSTPAGDSDDGFVADKPSLWEGTLKNLTALGGEAASAGMSLAEGAFRLPSDVGRVANIIQKKTGTSKIPDPWDPDTGILTKGIKIGQFEIPGSSDIADQINVANKIFRTKSKVFEENAQLQAEADEGLKEISDYVQSKGETKPPTRLLNAAFNPVGLLAGEAIDIGRLTAEALKAGKGQKLVDVAKNPQAWAGAIGSAIPSLTAAYASGGSLGVMAMMEGFEYSNDAAEFEKRTGTKISDEEHTLGKLQTMVINGVLEKAGLDSIIAPLKAGTSKLLVPILKAGVGASGEGTTEVLQQINANLAKKLTIDEKQSLLEGAASSFMGGFGAGGGMGGLQAFAGHIQSKGPQPATEQAPTPIPLSETAKASNDLVDFEKNLLSAVQKGEAQATPAQLKHLFTAYPQDALAAGFDQETIDAVIQDDSITPEQVSEEAGTVKEFFETEKKPAEPEPTPAAEPEQKPETDQARGFGFVSPSIEENMPIEESIKRLDSADHAAFKLQGQEIDSELGIKSEGQDAVGDWNDGSENSMVWAFPSEVSYDMLKLSSIRKAEARKQKSTLVFREEEDGSNFVYSAEIKGKGIMEVRDALNEAGIAFKTFAPTKDGVRVYVFDDSGALLEAFKKVSDENGSEAEIYTGRGEFIGAETRAGASKVFRDVAKGLESGLQKGKRVQGAGDSGRGEPGTVQDQESELPAGSEVQGPGTRRSGEQVSEGQSQSLADLQSKFDSFLDPNDLKTPKAKEYAKIVRENLPEFIRIYKEAVLKEYGITYPNVISGDLGKTIKAPFWSDFKSEDSTHRHGAASAAVKIIEEELLNDPARKDMPVLVLAGISGAGKTTSLKGVSKGLDTYRMVRDTNLSSFKGAQRIIDNVLSKGGQVQVIYTDRNPITAFKEGVYPRFKNHPEARVISKRIHLENMKSKEVFRKLVKTYSENQDVIFQVYDNTRGRGEGRFISPEEMQDWTETPEQVGQAIDEFIRSKPDSELTPGQRETFLESEEADQFQSRLAKETASTFEEEAGKVDLLLQRHGIERVVQLAAEILTPQGTKAFGVYRPKTKAIEIISQPRKSTGFHEAFHAIEEEVLKVRNHSKKELYEEVKKQTGRESDREAREDLADAFAEYANKREAGSWSDKVVAFFEDILQFLRGLVGKADPRHTLFDSILNPKNPYKVRIDSTGDAMYEEMSDREAVAYKIAQGQKPTPEEMNKFPDLAKIYEDYKGLFTQIKIARYTGNPLSDALESQLKEVSKKLGFQPSMQATNNEIADVDTAGKTEEEQKKIRGFIETVKESHKSPPKIQETVTATQKAFYSVVPNAQTILEADNLIKTDPNKAMSLAKNGKIDRTNFAVAVRLIHAANAAGQYEQAIDIIDSLAARATAAGQAVQILSLYNRLTPDGIVFYAQRLAVKGNRELQEKGRQPKYNVPPDLAIQLKTMATKIQGMKEGREKTLETAKLLKLANSVIPPSILSKISSFQTIMQLLNMKTLMRNLIGNAGFFVMENISDTVAATLDMVVGVATNERTQLMPKYGVQLQGAKIGFIEGVQDAIAGVDTSQTNTKFDLQPTTMFTDPILGSLEKALSISLRAPDRAFFQAAFDQELNNQLRVAGKTVPTMEMLDRARYEGLRRTFQDDNVMSRVFTGLKKILNARQQWGLGDMVIKYPKTPANILMRGIEYSPFNFVHTVGTLAGPLFGQKFDQRKFVQSTSRALVGSSLLIGTGFILASLGILRGRPDRDRDAEAMMRDMGIGSYTINLTALSRFFASGLNPDFAVPQAGDVTSSYDWFQPQAIGLAIGANLYHNPEGHQALEDMADVISSGVTTLIDQPLMQGVRALTQGYDSQSIMDNVFRILEGVPASFVPTFLNQIKQLKDNTSRNTGDVNYFQRMYNRVAYRVPFASETLEPRITVWGNDQQFYQDGSNNPFNVFINPAFINRYKPNPEAKMVLDIWRSTGIKTHFPRVADKKQVINGERVELEPERYTQFQRYIGHKTGVLYSALADNPKFMNAPDELKAKLLSNALTDISTAGKILILGHRPKRASMKVRALVAGGV